MSRRFPRAVVLAAVMVCSLLVSIPTTASADTGTPPVLQDIFGGPLHAEMYPSGLEVDSAGNVVIADTGNNQVAKYAPNGAIQLWRIGEWGDATNEFDNPRDIAIDAADNIYVMDTRNSRVVKLSPSGVWLDVYLGPVGDLLNYSLGVTIHGHILYVADTGRKKVRRIDVSGGGWGELAPVVPDPDGGQFPDSGCRSMKGIRDADADSAGQRLRHRVPHQRHREVRPQRQLRRLGRHGHRSRPVPDPLRHQGRVRPGVRPGGAARRGRPELAGPGVLADGDLPHRVRRVRGADRSRDGHDVTPRRDRDRRVGGRVDRRPLGEPHPAVRPRSGRLHVRADDRDRPRARGRHPRVPGAPTGRGRRRRRRERDRHRAPPVRADGLHRTHRGHLRRAGGRGRGARRVQLASWHSRSTTRPGSSGSPTRSRTACRSCSRIAPVSSSSGTSTGERPRTSSTGRTASVTPVGPHRVRLGHREQSAQGLQRRHPNAALHVRRPGSGFCSSGVPQGSP